MAARLFGSLRSFKPAHPWALALWTIVLLTSHSVVASANDPGLAISAPGIYDGQGRAVGYLYVNTSDALVTNYRVTGYGPGMFCINYSGRIRKPYRNAL